MCIHSLTMRPTPRIVREAERFREPDWRRDNVNTLIRRVSPGRAFREARLEVWRESIRDLYAGSSSRHSGGVNQYEQLYGDPVKWMREGWIDYLAPQLYWRDGGPQSFSSLLRWWRSPQANPRGVPVWPGSCVGSVELAWMDIRARSRGSCELERSVGSRLSGGVIFWNIKALQ